MNSLFTRIAVMIAFITVGFGVNAQSISSNLNARPGVTVGVQEDFIVTLSAGSLSPFTNVKLAIQLVNPAQGANIALSLQNPQTSQYENLVFDGSGASISAAAPFFLNPNPLNLRATFSAAGVYNYSVSILNGTTNAVIATSNESVTVGTPFVAPTIAGSQNGQNYTVGVQNTYSVSTTTGTEAGTMVRVFFKMNAAQAASSQIEYWEVQSNTWQPFPVNANGEAHFGPNTGFPLAAATTQFRATYNAAGTFNYKLAIYRVAAPHDTMAVANESFTVSSPVLAPPTLSSTLNGQTVFTHDETSYTVTTVANDYDGTDIRGFFKLANLAQVADINLTYEIIPGTFLPVTINANGIGYFGPPSGFPLADASTNFKAVFDAAGVYNYKIAIYDVNTLDTLASANESVTVEDRALPTIGSDLDGQTVLTDATTEFEISTVANDYAGTQTLVYFEALDLALVPNVNIEALVGATWVPVDISSGSSTFPPFSLVDGSETFRVTFDAAGTYPFKLSLVDVNTEDTLASSLETVIVEDPTPVAATILSDLDARTGVVINIEEAFTITTVANDFADEDVRIKITLETPAQAPNFFITYNSTTVTFDANGVAYIGAVAGFPLDDEDFDLEATFLAGGTFGYNIALVDVDDNVLAENDEEVFVLDNSSIADNASFISNTFPNPTEGIVNIQTTETGIGTLGVYTLTGKKVINQTINGSVNTVSLETLPAGMYIIKISQNEKDAVIRVVKK